jgi:hypothetical protein
LAQDSIEAHLTVIFAALAVARYLQARTGMTIKRLARTLRPLQTVTIAVAGQQITAQPRSTRTQPPFSSRSATSRGTKTGTTCATQV